MARPATCEAEAVQREIRTYLRTIDREVDAERIAQRLAREHGLGRRVVGFRRRGREVLLYDEGRGSLDIFEVRVSGHLDPAGTVWRGRDLWEWLDRHHHFLEWVPSSAERAPSAVA